MEQIIQIPDTLEIKEIKDNKIILVEKKKNLTYDEIAKQLFINNNRTFYTSNNGRVSVYECSKFYACPNNCTSRRQAEKLLAINKLMNVAKYLNRDWQPNWSNTITEKYYLRQVNDKVVIYCTQVTRYCAIVYFKSIELAKQAINILGEETIKLALCTDY